MRFPKAAPNPPLGAAEQPFESIELQVPRESLLVLFTDGLVESSEREIDEGLGDLARLLADVDAEDLGALCDALICGLLPVGRTTSDDIALLVARVHALAPERIACWPLPEDPRAAGMARGHVREQLSAWGLEELTPTTELLASELVGNVVRHGKGPMTLRLLRDIDLVCEVSDDSLTMPRIRHASETDEGAGASSSSPPCPSGGAPATPQTASASGRRSSCPTPTPACRSRSRSTWTPFRPSTDRPSNFPVGGAVGG